MKLSPGYGDFDDKQHRNQEIGRLPLLGRVMLPLKKQIGNLRVLIDLVLHLVAEMAPPVLVGLPTADFL